ncbi:N-acetylmuramoyl-L-alanine amidase [Leptolyngbyaceae cyanobacterium UHCC 1019]
MAIVPKSWMPNCSMKRIILHWTAGGYKASSLDLAHYHILIEDDGNLVRGTHSIQDNVSTGDAVYAAHTFRLNTGSIGVSVCCMTEAKEQPFDSGSSPTTQIQWQTMAQVVAELCQFYDIPVTPQTVLGHGEVEQTLGIDQSGKWDPMVLPWNPTLSKKQVGNEFRAIVKSKITGSSELREMPASITAVIQGKVFREAQIFNEKSFVKLRPLREEFGWMVLHANEEGVELSSPGGIGTTGDPIFVPYLLIDQSNSFLKVAAGSTEAEIVRLVDQYGFVAVRHLAEKLNLPIKWDGATRTVTLG